MNLYIESGSLVKDVQQQFSDQYPFLQIEFYKKLKRPNGTLIKPEKLGKDESFKRTTGFAGSAVISMSQGRTVAELAKDFEGLLGLDILVLRRSGTVWIETSLTEDWLLDQQNKEGELLSNHLATKK